MKRIPDSANIMNLPGSSIRHVVFYFGVLFLLFTLNGCTTISKWSSRTPVPVSGPVEIGPEWIEFTPPTPLVSRSGTSQRINIFVPLDVTGNSEDRKTIKLKDGRRTKIEAFLYDDKGNEFELFISGYGSLEFSMDCSPPASKQYVHFPNGEYTKLKIRSEIPIKVEKIQWKADYSVDEIL